MLDVDMLMLLKDRDTNRLFQYCSGDKVTGHYTFEKAAKEIKEHMVSGKEVRIFDDDDYAKLKRTYRDQTKSEDDNDESSKLPPPKKQQAGKRQKIDASFLVSGEKKNSDDNHQEREQNQSLDCD